ncbi:MAG: ankyrin repeat domain-containing protein [Betaproteobacteria bacterium]
MSLVTGTRLADIGFATVVAAPLISAACAAPIPMTIAATAIATSRARLTLLMRFSRELVFFWPVGRRVAPGDLHTWFIVSLRPGCNLQAELRRSIANDPARRPRMNVPHLSFAFPAADPRRRGWLRCTMAALALAASCAAGLVIAADDEIVPLNARFLVAARNLDAPAIERLLREGANVNARNRLGESALVIVLKKDRLDLASQLLSAGADVNLAAVNGITPLMTAAYGGHAEMVRTLLDKGAAIGATDRLKKNAMIYAAGEGRTAVVALFLARGVDPNAAYEHGLTALMWAAGYGQVETVRALLDAGARMDAKDDRGKSAIEIARENSQAAAAAVLESTRRPNAS